MIKKHSFCFLVLIVLAASSCSTINVSHVDDKGQFPENDGLYYSLPKTVVTMEVTVSKTTKIKGPYADYADKYLGLSDIITENSVSYSLDDIKMNSYPVPDPEQYYFVEIPKGCNKKNHIFLQLSEAGLLNSINQRSEAKLNTGTAPQVSGTPEEPTEPVMHPSVNPSLAESFDTIIEKINLDTLTIEKKVLKKIQVEKTTEQKAKEAVDFIMRVKENKFNLITGYSEVPYTGETIKYLCEQLDKKETEYLNLFTGITVKQPVHYYFTFVPSNTGNSISVPLFRFSPRYGIVDTSGFKGDNVIIKIDRTGDTEPLASFENAKRDSKKKTHGFYYRIPGYGKISVIYNDEVKFESDMFISQYGAIAELPVNKRVQVLFYPNSGAVRFVKVK